MFRLLTVVSAFDLEGAGPLEDFQEQVSFVERRGVETKLLVDPSQLELEMTILEGGFDCAFSPVGRCYRRRDDGHIVARDYDIAAVMERLDQPFIGTTYFRNLLVDDKTLANGRHGLAPEGILVTRALLEGRPEVARDRLSRLRFPQIVKPNALGGSLGIDPGAIVNDADDAFERLGHVFHRFVTLQEVRVERYLGSAREFTVAVLGNGGAVATSVTEILKPAGAVYSETEKTTSADRRVTKYGAVADGVLRGMLATMAHEVFKQFGLRDLARFDMLLDDRLYVIDINVPPVLSNSFSHEWQTLYGTRKVELLAFALAAFDQRVAGSSVKAVPDDVLAAVPATVMQALRPLREQGGSL